MMSRSLPPHLAAHLADLATTELDKAAFDDADTTAQTVASIAADALQGAVVVLFVSGASLQPVTTSGAAAPGAAFGASGVWAEALTQSETKAEDLSPLAGGGSVVRVGEEPLALIAILRTDLSDDERAFAHAAASVLHARIALDRQRRGLAESEARARAVVETSVDGVITIDARGRIETFNPGAERIFGYREEDVRGQNVHVLMPEPYHSEHDGYMQAYKDTGVRRIIGIGREVVGRRASGATFPMDLAVSEVEMADGSRLFVGLVRDISERRALEQEVTRISEEERRRIGQDLHDGLGQTLTGIGLFARGLARQLDAEGSASGDAARQVVTLLDEADAHARMLARSLVPVELERNGLQAALDRMAERATQLYQTTVRAETEGTGGSEADVLSGAAATHLFRIAQEAVSNAAQHGRAETIRIRLIRGTDRLRLRIEDDGSGFKDALRPGGALDPSPEASGGQSVGAPVRPADHRGMGLRIMHYRAHLAGGTLEIRPGADRGTVVTCTVPLRHAQL